MRPNLAQSPQPSVDQRLLRGIGFAVAAAFMFSCLGVLTKYATAEVSVPVVTFFRQLFCLLVLSPFLGLAVHENRSAAVKTDRMGAHLLRTVLSVASMYCLLYAISTISLADAILLGYTRPLWVPVLVGITMRKRIAWPIWTGLIIGFVGIGLILKPDGTHFQWGTLAGAASGLLGAGAILMVRRLGKTEPKTRILGYYFTFSVVIAALPLFWFWEMPSKQTWALLFAIGVMTSLYQFFLTSAYCHARATLVSTTLYMAIVFTLIWDWLLWDILPDLWSVFGILLVFSGAVLAIVLGRTRVAPGEQPQGGPHA